MSDPAAADAGSGSVAIVPAGGGDASMHGLRFGDMVWGKVKSHPWWPGHIYSITLTNDAEVHRGRHDGLVLVAFFGDSSYGWFEPHELVRFEDHFPEKAFQGSTRNFPLAVAEAIDEIARRGALALFCPCRGPLAFRPHHDDPRFLLVDVPGFDHDAEYHPDQVTAARERFVPRTLLDYLQDAAVEQRDAAEAAARTVTGIEMAAMLVAYRRSRFELRDRTYAEAFGVDPEKALAAEEQAAAERAQRARPLKGRLRTPEKLPGRRKGAAARLMEKIVPGAPAMKPKASKKDQYLLKRREDARAPALPAPVSMPEASHRPGALPDVYPPGAAPALDDGPPGFPADPPTPPLPSSAGDEELMLQRCAPPTPVALPPAGQASEAGAPTDGAPKKATKPKKVRKREREEPADAAGAAAAATGEPKKKKKKKKLADLNGGAASAAPPFGGGGGGGKPAFSPPKVDLDGLDLKQVISDLQNLPLVPFYGAGRRISDTARSFILAFRSKYYKKSYENDPPEESKKSLDNNKPNAAAAAAAAADGQPPKSAKKKPAVRPGDPAKAGVKRGPSDRQEELAAKKKTKLDKIKTLATDKKAGLEKRDAAAVPAAQQPRPVVKEKPEMTAAKKKEPAAAPAIKTPSPTALMMKFPLKGTLPSVASLKARFARFGPLDVDGIRVYWKSHMCRVIYKFQSDAEVALKYARSNAMFGQVDPHYYLRGVESSSAGGDLGPDAAPPQRSDLRLMETAPFRPGSSGNGAPLPLSRAVPARTAVGQPKSILKKSTDDGASAAAGALRDSPRVKFMLDGGDSKLEPPALPASGGGSYAPDAAAPISKNAKSVGFAAPPARPVQPNLQPPMRPSQQQQPLQPPRAAVTLPPPPPLQQQHLPYQPRINDGLPYAPRHTDGPQSFSGPPPVPPYQPRHSEGHLALPGQPPLPPYPPRAGFPGQPPYPPRSGDSPAALPGPPQQRAAHSGDDMPVWKRGEKEFDEELMRVMLGIAKLVEPLTDKNGNFPYHLFRSA